ncbi:uncharacterized protein LOC119676758 [Teleopsis dalmanni]|uniref:uncharacterized protein LOC119676758 n=1 Tax=Teleopsis dalmanni TaxID=139649 RepID=UPI0018CDCC22|nr:uncharacterized protein LOC119676758 [Teleopsis dalmanni]
MYAKLLVKFILPLMLLLIALLRVSFTYAQVPEGYVKRIHRNGRYTPEDIDNTQGKYKPDFRGKYHHIHIPYNGGYGDRGLKYVHADGYDLSENPSGLVLGPNDHLRFSIDFNYNGTGWQVIEFEWVRDGDEDVNYNYLSENQLWSVNEGKGQYGSDNDPSSQDKKSKVLDRVLQDANAKLQVNGEFDKNIYNVTYLDENGQELENVTEVKFAIKDVLDYIQTYILPSL